MFEYSTFISRSFLHSISNMLHYYKKLFAYLRHLGRFGAFADGREGARGDCSEGIYMQRAGFRKI